MVKNRQVSNSKLTMAVRIQRRSKKSKIRNDQCLEMYYAGMAKPQKRCVELL